MRVLIVDDEPPARRKVKRFLERDADVSSVAEAASGREALSAFRKFDPDLVFLDVQMPDMDGFAVLAAAPDPRDFHVVLLTAYSEHALRGFEEGVLDYLVKPVSPERFEQSLERAKARVGDGARQQTGAGVSRYLKRILVTSGRREIFVPVSKIDWIDAERNYVRLHVADDAFAVRATLESFARQLDPDQFARINRSQVVNLDRIRELQPWFHGERKVVLQDGRELMWTRRFRQPTVLSR